MTTTRCSFCRHDNPADAQFCNACGSSMKLQPCLHCSAINDISATDCHKCAKPLLSPITPPSSEASTGPQPEAVDEGSVPSPQRAASQPGVRVALAGVGVLALLATLTYLTRGPDREAAAPLVTSSAAHPLPLPAPAIAAVLPATPTPTPTSAAECAPALDALGLCNHPQR